MAGLQAEHLSMEFLRNFIPETVYKVEGDDAAPVNSGETKAVNAETVPAVEKPAATAKASSTVHQTPALPKLPKVETAAPSGKYRCIGKNNKGVVILVTVQEEEFQKLPQLGFLQKILSAIGLKSDDVAYLNNVFGAIAKFEDLKREMEVNYIISFASRLDTDLPHEKFTLYNPVKVGDVPVVFSLALEKIENDVEQKKLLWGALQQVFL
ncbi:hypothetical protein ACFSRY_17955 [Pontibacter locisalis]|uniref:Uncharacterized protein n=1 Tax=Pontibacter locisalis TaxID=1719035 RepID=A0ABW5IQB8_9BACT